ncbi:MAG: glycosyltransferase [Lachnospiraceae bacterium]|nr:glycosyltransferase [Lachnospiraceae bacterium]
MKFCFVILHYKTSEDTIKCIESILNLKDEASIVVVDNASNNGSIELVKEKYDGNEKIHFLLNEENLGFASGNNCGYKLAKSLGADFIAISNNDIIVDDCDFIGHVVNRYNESSFELFGPDIVSLTDEGHQSPMKEKFKSRNDVIKEINRYKFLLLLSRVGIYDLIKKNKKVRTGTVRKEIDMEVKENVVLHGSFVVFSPSFIKKEDIAFREGTFLYTEEAILAAYCRKVGYKMVFDPFTRVFHKEDSATNSLKLSNKARREFVFKNLIRSLSVYAKVLED